MKNNLPEEKPNCRKGELAEAKQAVIKGISDI